MPSSCPHSSAPSANRDKCSLCLGARARRVSYRTTLDDIDESPSVAEPEPRKRRAPAHPAQRGLVTVERVLKLYRQGLSPREVASQLGCSASRVYVRLADAGISRQGLARRESADLAARARELRDAGTSISDIAKAIGRDQSTIGRWLRRGDS